MKYAYSAPTRNHAETLFMFDNFRRLGYDGLQLKGGQYAGFLENPAQFLEEYGSDPGLVSSLILGLNVEDDDSVEMFNKIMAFARAVKSERLVVCLTSRNEGFAAGDIRKMGRATGDLGQAALDQGVKLSVHNHYQSPLMHRDDFDTFFSASATGSLGLTLDTAHAVKSGISAIDEIICSFKTIIDNIHLKDYEDGEWRVLGRGSIDFDPVFKALRESGYNGWVSTDEESGADLSEAMVHCGRFMRKGLDE